MPQASTKPFPKDATKISKQDILLGNETIREW